MTFISSFQDPFFDAPYPSGVRKTNVAKKENNDVVINNLNTKGNIPRPHLNDKGNIPRPDTTYVKGNIPRPDPQYEKYTLPVKKGTLAVFDETAAHDGLPAGTEDGDVNGDKDAKLTEKPAAGEIEPAPDKKLVREKKESSNFEGQERAILDYYSNMRKNNEQKKSGKFKKVQVQEEETGTERVQVNAGYENPRIACESGYNSCSGVVLKWVLTLYGTGE